jgi:hypothetical protein
MKVYEKGQNSVLPEVDTVSIFYDDRCELCKFSSTLIRGNNFRKIPLNGTPFDGSDGLVMKIGNGKTEIGFDAIFTLTKTVKILFPLEPMMFLLHISGIGDKFYSVISRKRHNGKVQSFFSLLNRLNNGVMN